MLDKLQRVLYRQQITKVEDFFRNEIRTLMRKTHFIDDIYIDENGNETNGYVAGIDISDSPVLARLQQERKIYEDGTVYFTVPYNSERLEEVWKFLEFLYFE